MANVFNASDNVKVIKADKAIVTVGKQNMLALGVTIQQVPVLGDADVLSIGKPSGTISIESLLISGQDYDITNNPILQGDGCEPQQLDITFGKTEGACAQLNKEVHCAGCIASAVTVAAQGGRGYIASGVQITFTSMSFG